MATQDDEDGADMSEDEPSAASGGGEGEEDEGEAASSSSSDDSSGEGSDDASDGASQDSTSDSEEEIAGRNAGRAALVKAVRTAALTGALPCTWTAHGTACMRGVEGRGKGSRPSTTPRPGSVSACQPGLRDVMQGGGSVCVEAQPWSPCEQSSCTGLFGDSPLLGRMAWGGSMPLPHSTCRLQR